MGGSKMTMRLIDNFLNFANNFGKLHLTNLTKIHCDFDYLLSYIFNF